MRTWLWKSTSKVNDRRPQNWSVGTHIVVCATKHGVLSGIHGCLLLSLDCWEILKSRSSWYLLTCLDLLLELFDLLMIQLVLFSHKVQLRHEHVNHLLTELIDVWSLFLFCGHAVSHKVYQHWAIEVFLDGNVLSINNLFGDGKWVRSVERLWQSHQLVNYASERPNVCFIGVGLGLDYLRTWVKDSTYKWFHYAYTLGSEPLG